MDDPLIAILTAAGLILVIEGALYALFPIAMRRMMATALALPPSRLRTMGMAAALFGLLVVWLLH